ncbi:hypothetical protein QL285_018102 [Trifolium repens]|nr:hypothetical protein QL285_018102 [Trifolium repens]
MDMDCESTRQCCFCYGVTWERAYECTVGILNLWWRTLSRTFFWHHVKMVFFRNISFCSVFQSELLFVPSNFCGLSLKQQERLKVEFARSYVIHY